MPNKKFNLTFDIDANLGPIKRAMDNFESALNKLAIPKSFQDGIDKTFSKLNEEIKNFEAISAKGFHNLEDISKADKSFDKILKYLNELKIEGAKISGIDPEKFLPKESLDRVKNLKKEYAKLLDIITTKKNTSAEIKKQTEELEKQRKKLAEQQTLYDSLAKANKQMGSSKGARTKVLEAEEKQIQEIVARRQELENIKGGKSSTEYKQLGTDLKNLNKSFLDNQNNINSLSAYIEKNKAKMASYSVVINATENTINDLENSIKLLEQAAENPAELDSLREKLKGIKGVSLEEIPTDLEKIKEIIENLNDEELKQINEDLINIKNSSEVIPASTKKAAEGLEELSEDGKKLSDTAQQVERLRNQVIEFFSIGNAVTLFKRAINSAYNSVKELDEVMTQTAVVTDFTVGDMWSQLPEYTKRANELGVAVKGAYESATLYYQQGLDTNEVVAVSTETLKMARIAGMDYADATNYMTAALRGFNMEINETNAQRINDVYSELAAITASDTQEIATAMTKTASIASNAGMKFETTAAFLSQIIETTREAPETAGTALKTVIARFQELKKDPSLIGEVDGEIVDANKIETALRTIDVALRDTNGQFRDLDSVFLEIAQKWNTLDTNSQRYIATMAAGSRQQSRFIAMMSDYARTMELVNAANNSAGASQKQFEKTLDSLESKLAKLQNAWQEFTMGIANSVVIKAGIDLLTLFINAINDLTGILPEGIDGIAKLGITLLGLRAGGKIFDNFFLNLRHMGPAAAATTTLKQSFLGLTKAIASLNKEQAIFNTLSEKGSFKILTNTASKILNATANNKLAKSTKIAAVAEGLLGKAAVSTGAKLAVSLGTIGLIIGVVTALGFGIKKLYDIIKSQTPEEKFKRLQNATEQAGEAAKEASDKYNELKENLDSLGEKYENINNLTVGTQAWRDAIQETNNQVLELIEKYKELAKYITVGENGELILNVNSAEVQQEVENYNTKSRNANIAYAASNIALEDFNRQQILDNLAPGYKIKSEVPVAGTNTTKATYYTDEELEELVKEYARGERGFKDDSDRAKAYREAGNKLLESENIVNAQYSSLLSNAIQTLPEGTTVEVLERAKNLADAELVNTLVENEKENGTFNRVDTLKAYAKAQGYSDKTGFRINGNNIVYQEGEEKKEIPVSDETLKTFAAMQTVSDKAIAAMQLTEAGFKNDILNAFFSGGLEGKGFTQSNIDKIKDPEAYAKEAFNELPEQLKNFYGDEKVFADVFEKSFNIAADDFARSQERLNEAGLEKINLAKLNENLDYGAVSGLSKNFLEVNERLGSSAATAIYDLLEDSFEGMDSEQANKFASVLNGIDWSNAAQVETLSENLNEMGSELGFTETETFNLEQQLLKLAGAMREVDVSNLLTQTKELRDTADDIRDRKTSEGITQEEYDLIASTNKFDMSQFSWTGQEWIYLAGSMDDLANEFTRIAGELSTEGAKADTTNNKKLRQEALLAKDSAAKISTTEGYTIDEKEQAIATKIANEELEFSLKKTKKELEKNNKELLKRENSLIDLASASKKASEEQDKLNNLINDNKEILQSTNTNTQEYNNALQQVLEQAKRVFGEKIDTKFIEENKQKFFIMAEGGKSGQKAFLELGKLAGQNFIEGLGKSKEEAKGIIGQILGFIPDNVKIGLETTFDATQLFKTIGEILGGVAKAKEALESMGYSVAEEVIYRNKHTGEIINQSEFDKRGYDSRASAFLSRETLYTVKQNDPVVSNYKNPSGGKNTSEWKNPYDKQYNTIEKINEELRKREILEKNFQRLQDQGKSTALLTLEYYNKLYKNLEGQLPLQEKLLEGRRKELANLTKKNSKYTKYGSYNEATGLIQIDWNAIDSIKKTDTKTGEAVENYISELERIAGSIEDVKGEILDIKQQQEDIKQELTDAFLSFEERVANAMEAAAQKDIDAMQEEFDALTDAESDLADAISKSIDEMRQARDNEKTEDEIAEKERRLAYLRQDTTGSNALEIKRLEEEIKDQREEYQDALVDQALTNLQEQNRAAAEQRERQIELAQSQLEYNVENGVYVKQVAGLIEDAMEGDHMLTKDDKLYEILHKGEDWSKLSEAGFQDMFKNLTIELNKAFSKLNADFAQDEDLTQFSKDYMAEMIKRYNKNGGILTQDILELNSLRNAKINDPNYTGSQKTLSYAELEKILKQNYTGSSSSKADNSGTSTTNATKTYTVKAGDSLSKIAKKELGNMNRWKEIASLNGISSPYTIYPNQKLKLPAYKTGGVADFTGPAWLDGSKTKPELILNARDTENFIILKDVLSGILKNASDIKSNSGDNYFDIDIQVDEIANDYDVDQMAERIKQNIYEDSTYRNVNAINFLR